MISEASGDRAFRTPAEEETEQIEERVEAMALGPANPSQDVIRAQHEQAAAQVMGRTKTNKIKSENVQKILSLSGLSAERKLQMISQLTNPEKKPKDQLDALAGRLNLKTEEASTAAYGDEKAFAQYNALPNVQLPPFMVIRWSLPNGGRCSFIWWIKIQRSLRL